VNFSKECFAVCGRRPGLLALDLGSIFEKLLHQKTFIDLSLLNDIIDQKEVLFP